jgi:hypothetical protein
MRRAYIAGHGEYMPPEDTWDLLIDLNEYEGASPSQLRTVAMWQARERKLPIEETMALLAELGDDIEWSMLIVIDDEHRLRALSDLFEQIDEIPHGDDTTYDYWPSGVRLAAALAPSEDDVELVRSIASEVVSFKNLTLEDLGLPC